jgi:hypothetical protein
MAAKKLTIHFIPELIIPISPDWPGRRSSRAAGVAQAARQVTGTTHATTFTKLPVVVAGSVGDTASG